MAERPRLYALHEDAEELWLDPLAAIASWESWAMGDDDLPTLYEHDVQDNRAFFPDGASVAEHLAEMAAESMGALFDEELSTLGEGAAAEAIDAALGDDEVVALLDQAMKLAADRCTYYVAGPLIRTIPVVRALVPAPTPETVEGGA